VKKIGPGACETVFVIGHCPAEGKKPLFTPISAEIFGILEKILYISKVREREGRITKNGNDE
jgi:hypothetical protein